MLVAHQFSENQLIWSSGNYIYLQKKQKQLGSSDIEHLASRCREPAAKNDQKLRVAWIKLMIIFNFLELNILDATLKIVVHIFVLIVIS